MNAEDSIFLVLYNLPLMAVAVITYLRFRRLPRTAEIVRETWKIAGLLVGVWALAMARWYFHSL